jgi:hypothetical protein
VPFMRCHCLCLLLTVMQLLLLLFRIAGLVIVSCTAICCTGGGVNATNAVVTSTGGRTFTLVVGSVGVCVSTWVKLQ